ncbi:unnamed protein product [Brassica napus]|uniref:(rape) hypothetical protein n=1 Tax=Brassica napus TaxID=3708 RepID=A0A816Z3N8_BRANA|nr:unnamed protein product [Brassica napus]
MAKDYVSSVLKSRLLILQLVFLSQHQSASASIVKFLPGFEGPLPFELETGYIGVGEEEEVQLFYYFIKSERNPKEDPLLLWLSGGPGCSSIHGLLFENAGPLTMKLEEYNGTLPSLVSTTYSWTKTTSIIFLDQPVGTGFSYSRTQLVDKPSDSGEAKRVHEFFQKWLGKHEEFISNPLYVGGDSYSGKVVPALVQEISKGNYQCCKPPINLQGYVLGNPLTEFETDMNSRIPFAHGMALISDELYESLKIICKGKYVNVDPSNTECLKLVEEYNKTSSIIYLDQPVGTGFSFSTQHVDTPSDSGEARRIHEFLQKWLAKHEEFIPNPFYVGGHSYTGKIVPPLVQEISKGNYQRHKPTINLQGYLLGNPVTEFEIDWNSRIPFAHEMALISDELYESLKRICKGKYVNVDPGNTECLKLLEEYNKFTKTVNPFLISEPSCETETPDCYIYRHLLATYWANDESVRRALQINKESIGRWVRCNFDIPYTHDIINSVPYHVDNSINGYRSLIFSGDHDLGVPYLGTQAWIRSLNYSVIDDWRPWMINNKPAGCTTTYANKMTFVTIKAIVGFDYREVGTQQSLNQRKALSCFKGGSVANLCKQLPHIIR